MISGTFNFMIVFQAEHKKDIVLVKSGELLESSGYFVKNIPFPYDFNYSRPITRCQLTEKSAKLSWNRLSTKNQHN
jgi:hypothetical protein